MASKTPAYRPQLVAGLILVLVGAGLGWAFSTSRSRSAKTRLSITGAGPTIDQIKELAELIVLRTQISDVLLGDDQKSARMAVLVRGDADLVIDLNQAEIVQKDTDQATAVLSLPLPAPVRPRVDHERTRIYKVEKTSLLPWKDTRDRLYEDVMKEAQKLIEFAANGQAERDRAKKHAEAIIRGFYGQFGWTVRIEWQ